MCTEQLSKTWMLLIPLLRWGDLTQVDSNVFQCSREAAGPKLITPSTDVIPGPMCGTKIRVYRMSCFSY